MQGYVIEKDIGIGLSSSTLKSASASLGDSGDYYCEATYDDGRTITTRTASINVYGKQLALIFTLFIFRWTIFVLLEYFQ